MIRLMSKGFVGLTLALALAACGNQPSQPGLLQTMASGVLKKPSKGGGGGPTTASIETMISTALANTDRNLTAAVIENRNAVAIMTEVESNGAVKTWFSPDKRSVSERGGIIVATRGLGFDLMSADVKKSLALISARRTGSATRIMRALDGENQMQSRSFSCVVTRAGTQNISIGEVKASARKMVETCKGSGLSFENFYLVDGSGRIVQSRQWLGPESGYIVWQAIRR